MNLDNDDFTPNEDYIILLIENARLSKLPVSSKEKQRTLKQRLLEFEKELPSEDIIGNTKLAFKN